MIDAMVPTLWMSAGVGIFLGGIFLRDEKNQAIAGKRFLDGANRNVAPDEQRQHHVGVNDDVADRQERQDLGNLNLSSFIVRTFHFPFSFAHGDSTPITAQLNHSCMR